jgi:hypothetical protein
VVAAVVGLGIIVIALVAEKRENILEVAVISVDDILIMAQVVIGKKDITQAVVDPYLYHKQLNSIWEGRATIPTQSSFNLL